MSFTTPDLSDENPDALALLPILKNLGGRKSFHGQIETLKCPDDNSFVKQLLNSEGKERILIVDANGINTGSKYLDFFSGIKLSKTIVISVHKSVKRYTFKLDTRDFI